MWWWDEEDESANSVAAWQMLEEAGQLGSQCWLEVPAAASAAAGSGGGRLLLLPGAGGISTSSGSLLPWELQWDLPLVQLVAAFAGSGGSGWLG
jgi:hypothetical protein